MFKAGSIYGEAVLDTKKWDSGISGMLAGAGKVAAYVGGAMVAAMGVAVKQANDYQKSVSNISTVVDTATVDMASLSREIMKLNPALGDAREMADGVYQAFSAGATSTADAIQITTDAAMFSKAALTGVETSVDVLTTAVNAYGAANMSSTKASDIFFQTIKLGKVNGEQLAGAIGKSIPVFAAMGVELEDLGAGLAAMTKQGINADQATTQLNGIVNTFLKPSADLTAALKAQGIESGSALLKTEGLTGALKFLEQASGGNKEKLAKLVPELEALKGVFALTGEGGEIFAESLEAMNNAAGSTAEAFGKQEKTFATFQNQMTNLSITVGNIGKYFVDYVAVGATDAMTAIQDFIMGSEGMNFVANAAGMVAGAFEALKEFMRPIVAELMPAFDKIIKPLAPLMQALGVQTGNVSGGFNLMAAASEGVAMGIRIISVVVSEGIKNLTNLVTALNKTGAVAGKFLDFITGKATWDEVKNSADEAGKAFAAMGEGVLVTGQVLVDTYKKEFTGFATAAEKTAVTIQTAFTTTSNAVAGDIRRDWANITTGTKKATEAAEKFSDVVPEGNDKVQQSTEETVETLGTLWDDYWKNLWKDSKLTFEGIAKTTKSVASSSLSSLENLSSQHYENEKAELDLWYQTEKEKLDAQLAGKLISQEQYDEKIGTLEQQHRDKQNAAEKKAFEGNKAFNIANVWMDAASAVVGWWKAAPQLGPVAGPIFAGVMSAATGTLAAAQTGLIMAQQFVPAKEKGGTAGGLTRINERGGELVTLPDGTIVVPNDISRHIAQSVGSGMTINVSFAGANISKDTNLDALADKVSKRIAERVRRG